ncbi:MAG: hypothetical protein KAS32_06325 [Candidatus Peribacteraceae bacterium]|nr:hypothetical protein [Candidatus Peribacteraceae bacterium]
MDGIIKKISFLEPGETFIWIQIESNIIFYAEQMNSSVRFNENESVTITRISICGEITPSRHNKINWEVSNSDVIPKLEFVTGKIIEFKPPNKVYILMGMEIEVYDREIVSTLKSQNKKIGDWITARCLAPPHVQIMKKEDNLGEIVI